MIWISPLIGAGSGALGGSVVYMSRSGLAIRARVKGANPKSIRQLVVRERTRIISQGWASLTQAQRDTWINAAQNLTWYNGLGQPYTPSGYDVFMQRNYNRLKIGGTTLLTEYTAPGELPARIITNIFIDVTSEVIGLTFNPDAMGTSWVWFFQTSPPQSPSRRSRRLLRETAIGSSGVLHLNLWSAYANAWATLNVGESIGIKTSIVDSVSGYEVDRGWRFVTAE